MVLRVARDVSTFVEPEPTAVFVCHLCPFRAEPRARANDPPSFTASITTRNVSLGNVVPSSRAKGRYTNRFPYFHRAHQWQYDVIDSLERYWTPSLLFTNSLRSTGIRHAFSTRPPIPVYLRSSGISRTTACPLSSSSFLTSFVFRWQVARTISLPPIQF